MASEFPSPEELFDQATTIFKQEFECIPDVAICAPEVMHLIGEHADVSEGLSLSIALEIVTVIVGQKNSTENICVISALENSNLKINFSSTNLSPGYPPWVNYIKGAIKNFPGEVPGFNALIVTSLPSHLGFSSGATLLVAMFTFLEALMNSYPKNLRDKALACDQAQHEYFGKTSGISSSIVSIFGEHRKVIFVDSRTLEYRLMPLDNYNITFIMLQCDILNKIGASDIEAHMNECYKACKKITSKSLRDLTLDELSGFQNALSPMIFNLAKYKISENKRVLEAMTALEGKDFHLFGRLVTESHWSLRNKYELQCKEVDQLIEIMMNYEDIHKGSVLGAHMSTTKRCIIVMINRSAMSNFMEYISTNFKAATPSFYMLHPSYGARVLGTSFKKK